MHVSVSARILGPEGFGVLAIIIAVCGLSYRLLAAPGNDVITTYVTRSLSEGRQEEAAAMVRFALFVNQALSLVSYALIVMVTVMEPDFWGLENIMHG